MKKLILSTLLIGLAVISFGQKFGHINSMELLESMPERAELQAQLETKAKELEGNMISMQQDYQAKVADFQANQLTYSPAVKESKTNQILQLEQGMQEFQTSAQQELQQLEQALVQPLLDKVQVAIEEVGAENAYTYIFDTSTGATVYNGGEDVMGLVKTKLGL